MRNSTGGLQARIANRQWIDSDATRDFNSVRGTGWIEERLEYRPKVHRTPVMVLAFWLALGAAAVVAVKVLL